MGKLAEIIQSGQAPGYPQGLKSPQCADVAVPRAFKELEQTKSASAIAKQCGFSVNKIKKIWDIK